MQGLQQEQAPQLHGREARLAYRQQILLATEGVEMR